MALYHIHLYAYTLASFPLQASYFSGNIIWHETSAFWPNTNKSAYPSPPVSSRVVSPLAHRTCYLHARDMADPLSKVIRGLIHNWVLPVPFRIVEKQARITTMKLKQKILGFFRKELNRFLKAALFCSMKHMQDKWRYKNRLLPLEIQMVLLHTACVSLPFYVYCFMMLSVVCISIASVRNEGVDM